MSLQVNNNIQTQAAGLNDSFASLEKTGSVQFLFALLQLELSQTNKTAAMEKINSIRDSQTDSKTYTDAINALRTMSDYDVEKYGELPTDLETIQQEIKTATAALEDLEQYADGDEPYYDEKNKTWATKQESTDYWYKNEYIKAGEASAFDALRVGGEEDHNLSEIEAGIEAVSTRLEALKVTILKIGFQIWNHLRKNWEPIFSSRWFLCRIIWGNIILICRVQVQQFPLQMRL